jgi:hypothetical protein
MENEKRISITPPEGYEIDKEKSTFTEIIFKKKEQQQNLVYWWKKYVNTIGTIVSRSWFESHLLGDKAWIYQTPWFILIDFYRWLAEQLNEGWKPDWGSFTEKFMIKYHSGAFHIEQSETINTAFGIVFKDSQKARQAYDILGEDLLKKIFQVK